MKGGPGSISSQGTRSHMPQLRVGKLQLQIPHAATKRSHMPSSAAKLINIFLNAPSTAAASERMSLFVFQSISPV